MVERWRCVPHVLFIAHVYAEFFGNRVDNQRFILPKAVRILGVLGGAFEEMNLITNDFCLFHPNAIVFYMVASVAAQNGKWQIAKRRCPPRGCLGFSKNNKQVDHGWAFGEAMVNQKDGSNNLKVRKKKLAMQNFSLYNL